MTSQGENCPGSQESWFSDLTLPLTSNFESLLIIFEPQFPHLEENDSQLLDRSNGRLNKVVEIEL